MELALVMLLCIASVLLAARFGISTLFALSACFIVASNITVQMTIPLFGMSFSLAVIIYSCVYLIADLVSEHYGKQAGFRLAACNLVVQLFLWAYVLLSVKIMQRSEAETSVPVAAAATLFGASSRITFAAVLASIGPFLDVVVYARIREFLQSRQDARRQDDSVMYLIARNKLSTLAAHVVNTAIFFAIAMFGTDWRTVAGVVATATLAKIIVMVIDTPFLILGSRLVRLSMSSTEAGK
jgi:uncharacterized integral membrane protein (TIGR00697 family)